MSKLKLNVTEAEDPKINSLKKQTEEYSIIITRVVDRIINKYCGGLDQLIEEVDQLLQDKANLDAQDINYYIITIPTQMYFIGSSLENVGIQADSATAIKREKFDKLYLDATGTINDKNSQVNQKLTDDSIVEAAFQRAYKKMRTKLDYADSLLGSLKKVLQWKISEAELTNRYSSEGTNFTPQNRRS